MTTPKQSDPKSLDLPDFLDRKKGGKKLKPTSTPPKKETLTMAKRKTDKKPAAKKGSTKKAEVAATNDEALAKNKSKRKTQKSADQKELDAAEKELKLKQKAVAKRKEDEAKAAEKTKTDAKANKFLVGHAKHINVHMEKAGKADAQGDNHRASAAVYLTEAEEVAKGNGMSFKDWVDTEINVPGFGYSKARKLLAFGKEADGDEEKIILLLEDQRLQTKVAVAKHREKAKEETGKTRYEKAEKIMDSLSAGEAKTVMENEARKQDMVLVSAETAKGKEPMDVAKVAYANLSDDEKVALYDFIVDDLGYE